MSESSNPSCCSMSSSLLWTIKEFQSWPLSLDCYIIAEPVSFWKYAGGDQEFTLALWQRKAGELCVWLDLMNIKTDLETSIKISLLDSELRPVIQKHGNHTFRKGQTSFVLNNLIKLDILLDKDNKLLYNGDLVICCEIRRIDKSNNPPTCDNGAPAKNNVWHILRSLLEREYYADFVVKVKDKKFLCHKCVLACRSEYFSAMFKSSVQESVRNEVVLEDIEPDIFKKLLRYIYTGEIDASEAETFQLLSAADRFCLNRLNILCEQKLHNSLCLENAIEMLSFASVYRLESLKMKSFLIARDFLSSCPLGCLCNYATCMEDSSSGVTCDTNSIKRSAEKLATDFQFFIDELSPFRHKNGDKKTSLPMTDIWCRSELKSSEKNIWTIKGFKERDPLITGNVSSHTFVSNCASWSIEVIKEATNLSINLKFVSIKKEFYSSAFQYKFSILNSEMMETNVVRGSCRNAEKGYMKIVLGNVSSILSSEELFHGDDLILCGRFLHTETECTNFLLPSRPQRDVIDDVSLLLNDQTTSDVVIKIESDQFSCHKAILSYYLPFICAKVQGTNRRGETDDIIEIGDIKPSTFKKVLSAMYTGECELTASEVWELFPLESKYLLFSTTSTFDDAFFSSLSVENAIRALLLTDSLDEKKLRKYVWHFIVRNLKEVMESPNWSDIAKNRGLLSAIIVASISKTCGSP